MLTAKEAKERTIAVLEKDNLEVKYKDLIDNLFAQLEKAILEAIERGETSAKVNLNNEVLDAIDYTNERIIRVIEKKLTSDPYRYSAHFETNYYEKWDKLWVGW